MEDSEGYSWELIQRASTPEPFCQIMLRVADLDLSIKFYEQVFFFFLNLNFQYVFPVGTVNHAPFLLTSGQALGMKLLLKYDNPRENVRNGLFLFSLPPNNLQHQV